MTICTISKLYPLDIFFINSDSDRLIFESLRIVDDHDFFWHALTVGSITGPLYLYLLSIPLFLYRNIHSPVLFFALLNIFSIFLCYRIGEDFFKKGTGFIFALLFAVFPTSVFCFRGNLYNTFIIPVFVLSFYYLFMSMITERKSIYIIPSFVIIWFSTQIHSMMICFFPIAIITLMMTRPGIRISHILIGCTILFPCFILGSEGLTDFFIRIRFGDYSSQDTSSYISIFHGFVEHPARELAKIISLIYKFLLNFLISFNDSIHLHTFEWTLDPDLSISNKYWLERALRVVVKIILHIELLLFFIGILFMIFMVSTKKRSDANKKHIILLLWLTYIIFAPLQLYIFNELTNQYTDENYFHWTLPYRYLSPVLPLPFLIIGDLVTRNQRWIKSVFNKSIRSWRIRYYKSILLFTVLVLCLMQVVFSWKI